MLAVHAMLTVRKLIENVDLTTKAVSCGNLAIGYFERGFSPLHRLNMYALIMDRRRDDARDFNGAGRALAHDARWLPQSLPRRARADLLDRRIERCARPNGGCDSVTEGCGQQQRIGTASGLGDGALIDSIHRTRTQTVPFII